MANQGAEHHPVLLLQRPVLPSDAGTPVLPPRSADSLASPPACACAMGSYQN